MRMENHPFYIIAKLFLCIVKVILCLNAIYFYIILKHIDMYYS